jgi:dipeptidyl-peptidase-4
MTRLTAARIFGDPPLSGSVPAQASISADARWVLYLAVAPDDRERLDLWGYDVASGSTERLVDASQLSRSGALSDAEKAERERRRQFSHGVTRFVLSPDGARSAFLVDGAVYLLTLESRDLRCLTPSGRHTDLAFSAGGGWLSWVRDGDLYAYDLDNGVERRCTSDASETVSSGSADFIAQEEMHRFEGHWWSGDDRWIAFTRVDTARIPVTHRYEFRASGLTVVGQRYPYAGAENADVRLGLLDLVTGTTRFVDWTGAPDDYLARVGFSGTRLWMQVENRAQTTLRLAFADAADPDRLRTVLVERQPAWLNLHDNLKFLPGGRDFVWTSERDGVASLYLHRDGDEPIRLTSEGRVSRVVHTDAGAAYYLGWHDTPVEQHLYRVDYATPGRSRELTTGRGWHEASVAPGGRWFVDRHSSVEAPPRIDLVDIEGSNAPRSIVANRLDATHAYAPYLSSHVVPAFGCIEACDGQSLWYRLFPPAERQPGRRYPVLVQVYGGPGVQRVVDDWAPLTLQLFVQAGFGVFELDNRGTGNREKRFEDPIHRRLGAVEVDDQLVGVEFLRSLEWVDGDRIGVFGGSYGGYMTLLCLARGAGAFRAGASLAPVTDWRLYDTHYTERYLGKPQDDADAYDASGVFAHLDGLRGELLLMHGMADDNVLFDHSSRLMLELQRRGVAFELMLYPGAKHAMQERHVAIHRFETLLRFFRRTLA